MKERNRYLYKNKGFMWDRVGKHSGSLGVVLERKIARQHERMMHEELAQLEEK